MRIALLISGRGSTATAIISACASGRLKGVVPACVISSRPDMSGLHAIEKTGMPDDQVYVVEPKTFNSPEEFGEAILTICRKHKVDFIGQYGWLVKTPENVIRAYPNMMTNQHNGPLPDFGGDGMYGMRVHCARLLFVRAVKRDFWSEATAQRVAVHFDEGAVLKTARVEILANDTPETLAARMLPIEHEVEIETLRDFASGRVQEQKRETPVVLPGEEGLLVAVKKEAIKMYPKG